MSEETLTTTTKSSKGSAKNPKTSAAICHCKKSFCLKLYCKYYLFYYNAYLIQICILGECFSNQDHCSSSCLCVQCKNNVDPENAEERKKACNQTLERNPAGFKSPKQLKEVVKGCHCLKSHCLKRYCECFQNQLKCTTEFCRCQACKNYDGSLELELQKSTNPATAQSSDINVIASASAHANNRKRTYLLIDDKDNESDRKIQVNTLTPIQALDYFNALLSHEAIKELSNYDITEKLKEKPDKTSLSVKELEAERKLKKTSQKVLNTFSGFFQVNKDVQRQSVKGKDEDIQVESVDLGKKLEKKLANAPLVGKAAKESKSGREPKVTKKALEDDHVIMEEDARDLNWKKRLMSQTNNENSSDSEPETKSPKKSKSKDSQKSGYMFIGLG